MVTRIAAYICLVAAEKRRLAFAPGKLETNDLGGELDRCL
jgi:hypothetical protein